MADLSEYFAFSKNSFSCKDIDHKLMETRFLPTSLFVNPIFIYSDRGSKRKKPERSEGLTDLMEKAKRLLAKDDSEASPSSSSEKRSSRGATTYHFFKDAVTGRRITHSKYKPRPSNVSLQEPRPEDAHAAEEFDFDDTETVPG